jgi:hypothetical protein
MKGASKILAPVALTLTIALAGCSATKPVTQAAVAPAAATETAVVIAPADAAKTETAVVATTAAVEDEALQLALKQEAEDYRKQVAEDIAKIAMVKGTRFMVDKAMDKSGMGNPLTKFVMKAAMDDMEKKAAADMKTAEGAALMDIASVVGRAKNNNARLGKMVVTVNLLVDQRKKDAVKIKVASVEEKKRYAARLDADEALLALALAASEEELAKIQKAGEKDAKNKDLVVEIDTTRKQGLKIREAMLVVKTMKKLTR